MMFKKTLNSVNLACLDLTEVFSWHFVKKLCCFAAIGPGELGHLEIFFFWDFAGEHSSFFGILSCLNMAEEVC